MPFSSAISAFQFYLSSIKSKVLNIKVIEILKFQFYLSSIKSTKQNSALLRA